MPSSRFSVQFDLGKLLGKSAGHSPAHAELENLKTLEDR